MGNTSDQPVTYPAKILYFFEHETIVAGRPTRHTFAFVRWYLAYHGVQQYSEADLELWRDAFENESLHCLLPVQRIYSPVATTKHVSRRRNAQRMLVVIPLEKKSHA